MIRVPISYGKNVIEVEIPEGSLIKELKMNETPRATNPREKVYEALAAPINSKCLKELAEHKEDALILIPDRTRPMPLKIILPLLLEELESGGISREKIKFLIGAGTHRAMTEEEIETHVGKDIKEKYVILNHEWWDPEQLVSLGETVNGTPIEINKLLTQASLKIAVGSIKPHRCAGWSGGAKMIQPGVSGLKTTGATHWLGAQYRVEDMIGNVNNPVREEMELIAEKVGLEFIINCVINSDLDIVEVFSGHFIEAHRACVESAIKHYTVEIDELADILIVGASKSQGNMWSSASGPNWGGMTLKKGGTVVLLAPCPEGVCREHSEVLKFGYQSLEGARTLVKEGKIIDLTAASNIRFAGEKLFSEKKIKCILNSVGVKREDAGKLRLEYASTPQEAVNMALRRYNKNCRIYTYPAYVFTDLIIKSPFRS
jgi:nickel-dependent lactate racemase